MSVNSPATSSGIVVRFAPSPTGKMHIGSARTALFNWLYAKHVGGQFLLRIEDTDAERSTPENTNYIFEAMNWLGLESDREPLIQSTQLENHKQAAQKLVDSGAAFVDEEGVTRFSIENAIKNNSIKIRNLGTNEGLSTEESLHSLNTATSMVWWNDLVQERISINLKQIEPFALLRSDGTPTYHLGVVCDDITQGVTHIIRGDDHINNTPKQILLYMALNAKVPEFGHIPLILSETGEKLSKRHGAASVQDMRDAGYLPQAIFNFLLRLGWGHADQEIFTRDAACEAFDIHGVSKGASRFDTTKLNWFNAQYLKTLPFAEVKPYLVNFLPDGTETHGADIKKLEYMWADLTARAQTLPEVATAASYLLTDPTQNFTEEHTAILLEAHHLLHDIYETFSAITEWTPEILHDVIANLVQHNGGSFKTVGRPLRVAITAQTGGPDMSRIMAALGQNECLRRLKVALHHVHENGGHHH